MRVVNEEGKELGVESGELRVVNEEANIEFLSELKFDEKGLVPAIIQDYKTNAVLMLGYMNRESIEKSLQTGKVHFYSRSRQKLWQKGETSGHFQYIKSISADCDRDTLLVKVEQVEAACHTGSYTCFFNVLEDGKLVEKSIPAENGQMAADTFDGDCKAKILQQVYNVVADRLVNPKEGSYTNYLFENGLDKILKKVGEETAEVIIAAKNKSIDEIRYEVADLFYHIIVLLVDRKMALDDIYDELKRRR